MHKSDFNYSLPPELIAQYPVTPRSASRLLYLDSAKGFIQDRQFTDLAALLNAGDLLIFNDTRVVPARLYGHKASGGRIEILIERIRDDTKVIAQIRASKPPKTGQRITLDGQIDVQVLGRVEEFYELAFDTDVPVTEILERIGHMPLPPYIDREDETCDRERYQTVYAREPGAVAAPTAGLHFDAALIEQLTKQGVDSAFVTLHVGAGTFQPIRSRDIQGHRMHAEYLKVNSRACDKINTAKQAGRRVIAVGTTTVRALETIAENGRVQPYAGETRIFIYPGYRFQIVDALLTNFHLPESTLLMLVCAFGGTENVLKAYKHAVERKYRFYSYGDAMFLEKM
ncbi:MAG: tRNA preQ1(34) S-adenosylmethionine ribosyltransferase-isomerase QueA [Gammaproteobacteria bacterium]|nr:tRNA preQ1(34) S-adenosylmethionine ribosyltransferase-isomerase QueA [Gammaproteobacteria bacterium]